MDAAAEEQPASHCGAGLLLQGHGHHHDGQRGVGGEEAEEGERINCFLILVIKLILKTFFKFSIKIKTLKRVCFSQAHTFMFFYFMFQFL